jgi:AsmA-like C-terminal region
MKRARRVTILAFAIFVTTGLVTFFLVSRAGSGRLEQWIGSQLQDIVNSRVNPRLTFSGLDYQYPLTVSLKDLKLVADDPRQPGQTLDIIGCGVATLTLAEVPRVGKPIVIQQVMLDKPLISIIAVEPGAKKFIGFSPFVRRPATGPASGPTTRPRPMLSDHLRMRLVQIVDGKIVYDPRLEGSETMELDQVNTTLNIEPAEPGWYIVSGKVARPPVFEISAAGQVNLDTFTARDAAVKIKADLGPAQMGYLPPQLQRFLTRYQVRGTLEALVMGEMPILRPAEGEAVADVSLTDANVTLGEYKIAINRMELSARVQDGKLNLPVVKVDALRGSLDGSVRTELNEQLDTDLRLNVRGMMLQDLLANQKEGEPPRFAGKIDANVEFEAPARRVTDKIRGRESEPLARNWGTGRVVVNEGRLVNLPTIQKVLGVIQATLRLIGAGDDGSASDRLNVEARLNGDKADVTELTLVSDLIAARGKGTLGLDRSLDLTLNAGPIERMQHALGDTVGGAIARVTDKVVSYRVTGKLGQPNVEVLVGGGAMDSVGNTLDRIGQGIDNLMNPRDKGQ